MTEEKKQRLKEYQKIIVRLKTSFIDVDMVIKVHFKIAIKKMFLFVLLSIFNNNKSL